MRPHLLPAIIFLIISSLAGDVFASTYYVATNGDNINPGSQERPWRTLSHAASHISGGDIVRVRGGTYNERFTISESHVTFRSHSGETPVIDGQHTLPGGWDALVRITGNAVTFDGFNVINADGRGILVEGGSCTIQNCHVEHVVHHGILILNAGTDNVVQDCSLTDCARDLFIPPSPPWAFSLGAKNTSNVTIRRNTVYNSYGEGINAFGACDTVLSECNVIYNTHSSAIYIDTSKNATVRYNLVYNSSDSGLNGPGIVIGNEKGKEYPAYLANYYIYGNLVAGRARNFAIWYYSWGGGPNYKNIDVCNNTFIEASTGPAVRMSNLDPSYPSYFRNNIIWQTDGTIADVSSSGLTCDYNLWSKQPEADAKGPHDPSYAVPLLIKTSGWTNLAQGGLNGSEFSLKPTSPAIGAGTPLGARFKNTPDCDKSAWPDSVVLLDQDAQGAGWEIGADIYVENPQNTPSAPTGLRILNGQ